jgi:hypothetical protein
MTPMQRTLAKLRADGYRCAIVERRIPGKGITIDLFGCIDVLAVRDSETLAVQTTSGSNVSARVRKIAANPNAPALRLAGWRIVVHGWRKASNGRYVLREVDCSQAEAL